MKNKSFYSNKPLQVLFLILVSLICTAFVHAQSVPDPMRDAPVAPPVGLPGMPVPSGQVGTALGNQVFEAQVYTVTGILSAWDGNKNLNRVIVNNKHYKAGDTVASLWRVLSITSTQVVFMNVKSKERKVVNATGEQL